LYEEFARLLFFVCQQGELYYKPLSIARPKNTKKKKKKKKRKTQKKNQSPKRKKQT